MKGFTLIEVLVVISILAMLTSFLVLYNRTGESQVTLLQEKTNIISTISRAKNLALGVLVQNNNQLITCGYGVYFKNNNYFIYQDLASDCRGSDRRYSGDGSGERIDNETYNLPTALQLSSDISDVLFVPPLPEVYFDGIKAGEEKSILLRINGQSVESQIIINPAGQISG